MRATMKVQFEILTFGYFFLGENTLGIAFESFKDETGKEPCLIAWIHSHVGLVECNFSSVDLHTQLSYSTIYDGILGLVLKIQENGQLGQYDFFELSRSGTRHVGNCSKKVDCNSRVQHLSCSKKSFYQSALARVMLREDFSLKVSNFMGNDQILEHDGEDFEPSKEFKDFEDENVKRTKKRKLSTNVYHGNPLDIR
jgi:hypothetical protein